MYIIIIIIIIIIVVIIKYCQQNQNIYRHSLLQHVSTAMGHLQATIFFKHIK